MSHEKDWAAVHAILISLEDLVRSLDAAKDCGLDIQIYLAEGTYPDEVTKENILTIVSCGRAYVIFDDYKEPEDAH